MNQSFWQSFQSWEKQASEAWGALIRSPEFIDQMNRQLEDWLLLRRQFDCAMDQILKANGLPTRAEQDRILFLIHQLTSQVEELEERVSTLVG